MATQQENGPMVSEVSICNQALSWLGQPPITSLDDKTTISQLMRNNYSFIRDAVLEAATWTFAVDRHKSITADKDAFGVAYTHAKPLNWVSVYRVFTDVSASNPAYWIQDKDWRMEGGKILTPNSVAFLQGTKRISDTGMFSPLFVQALAARLAWELCIPITENDKLVGTYISIYAAKMKEAKAGDGMQGANDIVQSRRLVGARRR
jgi:hypothetical protein